MIDLAYIEACIRNPASASLNTEMLLTLVRECQALRDRLGVVSEPAPVAPVPSVIILPEPQPHHGSPFEVPSGPPEPSELPTPPARPLKKKAK